MNGRRNKAASEENEMQINVVKKKKKFYIRNI